MTPPLAGSAPYVNEKVSGQNRTSVLGSRFQLDSTVDLPDVLDRCPAHMTGADLYALCSDAMMAAIKRKIALIEDGKETGSCLLSSIFTSVKNNSVMPMFPVNRSRLSATSGLDSEDSPLRVSAHDFSAARESFRLSVSDQELQRYRDIQNRLTAK